MITKTAAKVSADQPTADEAPAPQLPSVVVQERKPRAPAGPRPISYPAKIAKAIIAITNEIGRIQKEGYNEFQKYRYTRWEDISERLSPLLGKHGLVIVQTEQNRSLLEENDKGSTLAIIYHFTIVNQDGEIWPPVEWTAIARLRDQKGITDDKAASKCHTQAEKQFVIKLFKIRSDEGYNDEDHHDALPKKDARALYQDFINEMDAAAREAIEHGELTAFLDWGRRNADRKRTYAKDWQEHLTARFNDWRTQIEANLEHQHTEEPEHADAARSISGSAAAGAATEPSSPAPAALSLEQRAVEAAKKGGGPAVLALFKSSSAKERTELKRMFGEAGEELVEFYPSSRED